MQDQYRRRLVGYVFLFQAIHPWGTSIRGPGLGVAHFFQLPCYVQTTAGAQHTQGTWKG